VAEKLTCQHCGHEFYSTHVCPVVEVNPHQHRFTVAVEWSEETVEYKQFDDNDGQKLTPIFRHRVTVLRCETCPEEITRG